MINRSYYSSCVADFLIETTDSIIGKITQNHHQNLVFEATGAWRNQIEILKESLVTFQRGFLFFEFLIPRIYSRADVVLLIDGIVFVLEFKVGESHYKAQDLRQAEGYALDLSYFHETSHDKVICPILIATKAMAQSGGNIEKVEHGVLPTIQSNIKELKNVITSVLAMFQDLEYIEPIAWVNGHYEATPTIIEAATALYAEHDVAEISRSGAGADNMAYTVNRISQIIVETKLKKQKSICFVTGVPGAGKTLVGLKVATLHSKPDNKQHAVFLSGNGPLVDVLQEALARDSVKRKKHKSKQQAFTETKTIIQIVHKFRDEYLHNKDAKPENIVIFDEAQRAWNTKKTADFMQRKKHIEGFNQSEPEFLIGVMDRQDWCAVIALIGGGQEINDGEAGLNGWIEAIEKEYKNWHIYYSDKLTQREYVGGDVKLDLLEGLNAHLEPSLHLATCMRSFRAEKLSHFIHYLIHNEPEQAFEIFEKIKSNYSIYITHDLQKAKSWIKSRRRGMESCGLVASAGAKRLKAEGINVDAEIDARRWFLNSHDDVRSSHFLEDVATEFLVQGLELDWVLMAWDADYRYQDGTFEHWKFKGTKWQKEHKEEQKRYLENSYRVLLTRARQGMVIYVPLGNDTDSTRPTKYYQGIYEYLKNCGVKELFVTS